MKSKIIVNVRDVYKGWEIYISRGYENSNDLKVIFSPGVKMDRKNLGTITDQEWMKLHLELQSKREKYSHELRVRAKEKILFFFKMVPWDDAEIEAKKHIDSKIGAFDLNKFINAI